MTDNYNTIANFNHLVAKGDIIKCEACGNYNAYAWQDVNMLSEYHRRMINDDGFADGGEPYTDEEILTNWPDVYWISTSSGFEWECGKCHTHWIGAESPLNHPCYTHSED